MRDWFDGHVHAAPDVIDRKLDDSDLLWHYVDGQARGFVLKAHHESTVGRAAAARRTSGLDVVGGVALNHATGGLSPATVFATLRAGGRVVWMPTADAAIHAQRHQPRLCDLDSRVSDATLALPPADTSVADDVRRILDLIAEHDAVLATGHISADEVFWLVEAARAHGVRRILATHPSYVVPGMGLSEIADLAAAGVHIEITAHQLLHQPGCTAEMLASVASAAGRQLILASDVGQTNSPLPKQALEWLTAAMVDAGADPAVLADAQTVRPTELFGTVT
ncbi:MAG: DUF6282 family protein [Mycobacterium sp.]